jgi:hypothetical protein
MEIRTRLVMESISNFGTLIGSIMAGKTAKVTNIPVQITKFSAGFICVMGRNIGEKLGFSIRQIAWIRN